MNKTADQDLFGNIYRGKRVFITGHSGFKGSWLSLWLHRMGAIVKGYSLIPEGAPCHFELLHLDIESVHGDIRNRVHLEKEIASFQPDIVFHLAAQPLVRYSYEHPVETFDINLMGALNLFEACRKTNSIHAIIHISSDNRGENRLSISGTGANETHVGHDPYSASKSCSEILTSSYRNCFWNLDKYGVDHNVLLASCGAGNVVGGGDWTPSRLIPDIVAAVSRGKEVLIRSPHASRPWQHVLDPLSGYLLVGQKLLEQQKSMAKSWHFGPSGEGSFTVRDVLEQMRQFWPEIKVTYENMAQYHEALYPKLDCSAAQTELQWNLVWENQKTFEKTADWYKAYAVSKQVITSVQLDDYLEGARNKRTIWTR